MNHNHYDFSRNYVSTDPRETVERRSTIVCPIYNVERLQIRSLFQGFGISLPLGFVPNFLPAAFDVARYLSAHAFLTDAIFSRYQFKLETLVHTVSSLNWLALLPGNVLYEESEEKQHKRMGENLLNICMRAYRVVNIGNDLLGRREVAPNPISS